LIIGLSLFHLDRRSRPDKVLISYSITPTYIRDETMKFVTVEFSYRITKYT